MNPLSKLTGEYKGLWPTFIFIHLCLFGYSQDKPDQLFKKGMERQQHAEFEQAIDCYNKALAIDSVMVKAYLQRGFCKVILKDYEGGIADYSRLLFYEPNHTWAWISRGSARNKLGDFTNAILDFNKALEIDPQNQEAFNNRGFAKKGLGDQEGACDDWTRSKKMGNEEAKIILKNNHCK